MNVSTTASTTVASSSARGSADKESVLATHVFKWLLQNFRWRNGLGWQKRLWWHVNAWSTARYADYTVDIHVHGTLTRMNFGHSYPLFARMFPSWNSPLLEIVAQSHEALGRPLKLIDVGAGIGDTVLLIEANCRQMVERYLCVDGDPQFHRFIEHNLAHIPTVASVCAMLSARDESVGALVRHHAGTASAKGERSMLATTLDALVERSMLPGVDVLKIDVDGFDGQVLAGSHRLLSSYQPAVIFEWHPLVCLDTNNSPKDHFKILGDYGYDRFIWFNKFGLFSHFTKIPDAWTLEALINLALNKRHDPDWHYDVIALSKHNRLDHVRLAELPFAKRRKSWY